MNSHSNERARVGFTGPRDLPKIFEPLVRDVTLSVIRNKRLIVTGCANGSDKFVVQATQTSVATETEKVLFVYKARERCGYCHGHGYVRAPGATPTMHCDRCGGSGCKFGSPPGAFAKRSEEMCRFVAEGGPGSAMIGFPDRKCPHGIVPGSRWSKGQPSSGTWSSLALAYGLGLPVLIFPCTTEPSARELFLAFDWPERSVKRAGDKYPWNRAWMIDKKGDVPHEDHQEIKHGPEGCEAPQAPGPYLEESVHTEEHR